MISDKSYAKAYLLATQDLDSTIRVAWLMVLTDPATQRTINRLFQQRDRSARLTSLGVPVQIRRFLEVVADDRVMKHLSAIAKQGLQLSYQRGIATPITLELATKLSQSALSDLTKVVAEQSAAPPVVNRSLNPHLLGGLRLTIGSQSIDRSVRGSLAALKTYLAHS